MPDCRAQYGILLTFIGIAGHRELLGQDIPNRLNRGLYAGGGHVQMGHRPQGFLIDGAEPDAMRRQQARGEFRSAQHAESTVK